MMITKHAWLIAAGSALTLAGCSPSDEGGSAQMSAEMVEGSQEGVADSRMAPPPVSTLEPASGESSAASSSDSPMDLPPLPSSIPAIAYDYGLAFTLPAAEVGTLMRRHAALCEQQGPTSCRIVGMDLTGSQKDDDVRGTLRLQVASQHARAVGALLEREAGEMDAEQTGATITSEEVSKQIVDAEARIAAREELRDRLTEVLRTRKGSVRELVEAERQVAQVNEEIDQAKSWLATTKGRVAMSNLEVGYTSEAALGSGLWRPLAGAFDMAGSILGTVLAALLILGLIVAPIAALAWGFIALKRRMRAVPAS